MTLFEQAISDLEQAGATVVDALDIPGFDRLSDNQWCAEFRKDLETFLTEYVQSDSLRHVGGCDPDRD